MTSDEKIAAIANIIEGDELQQIKKIHFEPCPFCGGTELNIFKTTMIQPFNGTMKTYYKMSCYNCDCEYDDGYGRSIEDLANHWNKRGK